MVLLLALLNTLNVLDWLFTLVGMERGAVEGNPVMAYLFGLDPLAAGLFKVGLFMVVTLVVWRGRAYRRLLEFAVIATGVYAALVVYHVAGLALILPSA